MKQERRKARAKPASRSRARSGREITPADWAFFYRCYERTYRDASFDAVPVARVLRAHRRDDAGQRAAGRRRSATAGRCAPRSTSSTRDTLWGRYWGTTEYVPGLHFEACYYQAIEFCIERRIARFEGGAQGVHKLARGLAAGRRRGRRTRSPIPTSRARSPTSARASASTSRTPSTSSKPRVRSGATTGSERVTEC